MEIVEISNQNQYWRNLIYGLSGAGKTTFLGSAELDPRLAPVLWIDAGGNPISLRQLKKQPKVIRMTKLSDLNHIYDWLFKDQPENHPMVTKVGCVPGYKTIVLDGLTRIQYLSFQVAMGDRVVLPGDMPAKPEWPEYGKVLANLNNGFIQFYNLPMHVLVTALEDNDKRFFDPDKVKLSSKEIDDSDWYYQAVPAIDGKAAERIPGIAEMVVRIAPQTRIEPSIVRKLEKESGKRIVHSVAQFRETRSAYAKDQYNLGINYMGDPTMSRLMDLFESE